MSAFDRTPPPGGRPISGSPAELLTQARALEHVEPQRGLLLAERALALAHAADDQALIGAALVVMGQSRIRLGDASAALTALHEAHQLLTALGDLVTLGECLRCLGMAYTNLGDLLQAFDYHARSLDLARQIGDHRGIVAAMNTVATNHVQLERYDEALALHAVALALARSLGDDDLQLIIKGNTALALNYRGERRMDRGEVQAARADFAAARDHLLVVVAAMRRAQLPARVAHCLGLLACSLRGLGEFDQALAMMSESLDLAEALGVRRMVAIKLGRLGDIYYAQGRYDLAIPQLLRASTALAELGIREELAAAQRCLALSYEAIGDYRSALAQHKAFHDTDLQVRGAMAEQRAQMLEASLHREQATKLAALNEQLQDEVVELDREAHQDGLTGLANRRELDRILVEHVARSRANGSALTVVLMDLDHFKQINDRFSHATGDEVLRTMGQLLRGSCRARDLAARYGGEEFALILPGCDRAEAAQVCERLRLTVERFDWSALHPELLVTISVGYCSDRHDADAAALLADADAQLYRAKRLGRNRVCSAAP